MAEETTIGGEAERRPVRLLGAPIPVLVRLQRWLDDVFRELRLVEVAEGSGPDVPPRLRMLGGELRELIGRPRAILAAQVEAASAQGEAAADLEVDLGPHAVNRIARMLVLLDEIDEHSQAGQLLTPPRDADMVWALRWLGREFIGQLEIGRPPRPYHPARPSSEARRDERT